MFRLLKDLMQTLVVSLLLALASLAVSSLLYLPIPDNASQRPIFILGIILFSLVFWAIDSRRRREE